MAYSTKMTCPCLAPYMYTCVAALYLCCCKYDPNISHEQIQICGVKFRHILKRRTSEVVSDFREKLTCMYVYMYVCIHTHVHTYMNILKRRTSKVVGDFREKLCVYVCIHTHTHTHTHEHVRTWTSEVLGSLQSFSLKKSPKPLEY